MKKFNEYFHQEESDTDYDTIIDEYTERLESIKSEIRDSSYEDLAGYNTSNLYDMVVDAENYMNDAQDETTKNKLNDLWSKLDEAYRQIEDMQYQISSLDNLKNNFY